MRLVWISIVFCLLYFLSNPAIAEKKVALVIGNEAYIGNPFVSPLSNTGRDAQIVATALEKAGFSLIGNGPQINLDMAKTITLVSTFGAMAKDADIALFYFSGHGMESSGKNYLIPIGLTEYSATSLMFKALDANRVLDVLDTAKARIRVVLLDACRTPFKGAGEGLGAMPGSAGTVIGFASQPRHPALPGASGASPYARALETYLRVKGLELYDLLNEVGLAVMDETKTIQQPWVSQSAIKRPVYLNPPPPDVQVAQHPIGATTDGSSLKLIQQAYGQLDTKNYSGARATLTRAINEDPESALAYSYRGFSWFIQGNDKSPQDALADYRQAFVDLDRAIELNPALGRARRHRGNTILATYRARTKLGLPTNDIVNKAIEDFETAMKLDPTKINAFALGEAFLYKGLYGQAIQSFQKAIDRDKTYAAPYSGICFAYRMTNRMEDAKRYAGLAADRDDGLQSRPCLTRRLIEL
jgi:tetratricopeptide (TPR) repeat protein